MLSYFLPDLYISNIYDLPIKELRERKINTLIFDIDNTIVSYDKESPSKLEIDYMKKLMSEGFKVALLSNNSKQRVAKFNQSLNLVAIHRAAKPFKFRMKKVIKQLDSNNNSTAIIGDQLFTDIWCGKKLGVFTILVTPITSDEGFTIRLKRILERKILDIDKGV